MAVAGPIGVGKTTMAELVARRMGALLVRYSSALATDKFFVPVILLALLGVALSSIVEKLQKKLAPWKETERAL